MRNDYSVTLEHKVFGIYIDTDVIHVRMCIGGQTQCVLNMPAVYIFNDLNEVLTGNRAVRYQKCHKEKTMFSVIGFMKDAERFQNPAITESAERNCRVLMKELKKNLDKITDGQVDGCVVTVASSDLKIQGSVRKAMAEAGFRVLRSLNPASACAISKAVTMKQGQQFQICAAVNGEKQTLLAEYSDSVLELLENKICSLHENWAVTDPRLTHYHICDEKSRREFGREAASYENLAVLAADGAVVEGLILIGHLKKDFLLVDVFPWKLGVEIVGRNQEVCLPLTWIINGQEAIPVKKISDGISLNASVRGDVLRLYAANDENGKDACIIKEWQFEGTGPDAKQLQVALDIETDYLFIGVELKADGKTVKAEVLPSSLRRVFGGMNTDKEKKVQSPLVYVPKHVMHGVQYIADRFSDGVNGLHAGQLDDSIGKGVQMIAKQSRELAEFCRTAGDTVRTEAFIEKILVMTDNLEYGIRGIARSTGAANYWEVKELLFTFYREMGENLRAINVTPVEAEGMNFDPYVHDAMMEEAVPGVEENVVTEEIQKGYYIGEKLYRPAKVKVSK